MIGSPGTQGSKETLTWDFIASSALAGGDTVSSPSVWAYTYTASNGAWSSNATVLSGSPTISGSNISHVITSMSPGKDVLIEVAFSAGGTKKLQAFGIIRCPL